MFLDIHRRIWEHIVVFRNSQEKFGIFQGVLVLEGDFWCISGYLGTHRRMLVYFRVFGYYRRMLVYFRVFEYLQKSDVLNCQHSQAGFMCTSFANKAALWQMYGKR